MHGRIYGFRHLRESDGELGVRLAILQFSIKKNYVDPTGSDRGDGKDGDIDAIGRDQRFQ